MIFWLLLLGIVAVGIGIVVVTGMREGRIDEEVASTADWLETKATIQSAVVERIDRYTDYPSFAFSYTVQGEYFSGKFFLRANQQESEELIKTLLNQEFPVQYDPNNPSAWYIAEATIASCEIIQKLSVDYPPDSGPYRSDGDLPIDLNLDRRA
jgi:hypothetical protein